MVESDWLTREMNMPKINGEVSVSGNDLGLVGAVSSEKSRKITPRGVATPLNRNNKVKRGCQF